MNRLTFLLAAATPGAEPVASGAGLGIGALALLLIVLLLLSWMGYLYLNSRRSKAATQEAAPPNLSPPASDDELENVKLTRVLRAAFFSAVLVAIILPWYAFNEPGRQSDAMEVRTANDIKAGAHWYSPQGFTCADCHGPAGVGGASAFTEERSGVGTTWNAPALDDIFFRYDEEEIRDWIVFGIEGTPMPASGLDGGGAMTIQELDQLMLYLHSIQITQPEAFAKAEGRAERALTQIEGGQAATEKLIAFQEAQIREVRAADDVMEIVGTLPDQVKDLLQAPGTCTPESAELVNTTCDHPGSDVDRDGLTDEAERGLTQIAAIAHEQLTDITYDDAEKVYVNTPQRAYEVRFQSVNAFTNIGRPDLDVAEVFLTRLSSDVMLLGVTAEREEQFLEGLEYGLIFLENSLEQMLWKVDFDEVAVEMGVSVEDATLAVGLFNASCSQCHTSGFSAGPAFNQGPGTGAWGPSLVGGRSVIQFPDIEDNIAFVKKGSQSAQSFGMQGLGTGRMPAFGKVLSERQIELIVIYSRTL